MAIHLLDHPGLRRRMSLNGRELAEQFDKTGVAIEWISMYESPAGDGNHQR